VELYYQCQGYLTSSNKWISTGKKKQRSYTDIDVFAVNAREIIIVSVSSNMDDKRWKKLIDFYKKVSKNLSKQYGWLFRKRKVKYVLAVINPQKETSTLKKEINEYNQYKKNGRISVLEAKEIFEGFRVIKEKGFKIENPLLRTIQLARVFWG
jgi:hypothetical protein